jgi:phosphatidylserine decarboxylase
MNRRVSVNTQMAGRFTTVVPIAALFLLLVICNIVPHSLLTLNVRAARAPNSPPGPPILTSPANDSWTNNAEVWFF